MKSYLGIGLFVIVGLLTAMVIGFSTQFSSLPYDHDDEQTGLSDEIVIKFSFIVAENTPKGLAAQRFARLVKEKTKNQVKVELFPNSILYDGDHELAALQRGDVQMVAPSFSNISEIVPDWAVMDIPFAFANNNAVEEALNGEIGARLFEKLESENIVGMAFWNNGFKQMTSNVGPLLHPTDFSGLRFRIMPSEVLESQFQVLGAITKRIEFNQVFRSLESGIVDGEENTISNIYSKKFYQVQKYMTLSNHGYLGYGVLMNKSFWNKLPDDLQRSVREAMNEATVWANQRANQINQMQLEEIEALSPIQIDELTPEQRLEWVNAFSTAADEIAQSVDPVLIELIKDLQHKYAENTNTDLRHLTRQP